MSARILAILLGAALVVGLPAPGTAGPVGRPGPLPEIQVRPTSGPGGITVQVRGRGFVYPNGPCAWVDLVLFDAYGDPLGMGRQSLLSDGSFRLTTAIPESAAIGPGEMDVIEPHTAPPPYRCAGNVAVGATPFTVTP